MDNVGYINSGYKPFFTEENITKTVNNGTYAMIESISSQDEGFTEDMHNEKFSVLEKLLEENLLPHQQITGSYEGFITKYSFFVVKPENSDLETFRKTIFTLGQQFKQESVIISSKGDTELVFTTGNNVNKALTGKGFNSTIGKNFSELKTTDGKSFFIGEYYLDRQNFSNWKP